MESLADRAVICSPYISAGPVRRLVSIIESRRLQDTLALHVITDVSAGNLAQGSTDIAAIVQLTECVRHVTVTYLPRIHAKVYVSGDRLAILGSANFTEGGARGNLEYGVLVSDRATVQRIDADIEAYGALGGLISPARLQQLSEQGARLRRFERSPPRSSAKQKTTCSGRAWKAAQSTESLVIRCSTCWRTGR
jgi:hypothetical protein